MDTTETYIKMCEKAEEIQAIKPTERNWLGNIYYGRHIGDGRTDRTYLHATSLPEDMVESSIWLPRQDQLQEMVELKKKEGRPRTLALCEMFNGYCATHTIGGFTSMEQLWMAFVMKKKHNEDWNGTEWIAAR